MIHSARRGSRDQAEKEGILSKACQLRKCKQSFQLLLATMQAVVSKLVPGSGADRQLSFTSLASVLEKELRSWLGLAEPVLIKALQVR